MPLARADLESLLRARKLDRTLTSLLPALPNAGGITDEYAVAPTGVTALDARLGGGFPRGQISDIAGARSSGRTSLLLQMLAAATRAAGTGRARRRARHARRRLGGSRRRRSRPAALDPRPGRHPIPGLCRDLNQRALDQAIKALTLVLQAGNFGLVVFDAADAPAPRARAAAVHDLAAAAAHDRRQPDGVRAGRGRADRAECGEA